MYEFVPKFDFYQDNVSSGTYDKAGEDIRSFPALPGAGFRPGFYLAQSTKDFPPHVFMVWTAL
jgi:hypothetical protein